jgi:hypothetical protein
MARRVVWRGAVQWRMCGLPGQHAFRHHELGSRRTGVNRAWLHDWAYKHGAHALTVESACCAAMLAIVRRWRLAVTGRYSGCNVWMWRVEVVLTTNGKPNVGRFVSDSPIRK